MLETIYENNDTRAISSDVKFYTVKDVIELTGWSRKIVERLFSDPSFPSANFGRAKIVEAHALITYFSKKRDRYEEKHWKDGGLLNELQKKIK